LDGEHVNFNEVQEVRASSSRARTKLTEKDYSSDYFSVIRLYSTSNLFSKFVDFMMVNLIKQSKFSLTMRGDSF